MDIWSLSGRLTLAMLGKGVTKKLMVALKQISDRECDKVRVRRVLEFVNNYETDTKSLDTRAFSNAFLQ